MRISISQNDPDETNDSFVFTENTAGQKHLEFMRYVEEVQARI
jgi:hypothetical protein